MNVRIEPLQINQSDLNTRRMLDLMAANQDDGRMPLYLLSINRILRDMRISQQDTSEKFNYEDFKRRVDLCKMTSTQLAPLTQRLDTLESFMPEAQIDPKKSRGTKDAVGNDWTIEVS
jgi:hypothetical protein